MNRAELLLPAGNLEKMRAAFAYGADAVYAGQPRYSLRMRNNEFRLEDLRKGIQEAHALGKKFYVTANILPHNDKIKTFVRDMEAVIAMGPDAMIMADPGLISLTRETWPEQEVHLSVQANTMNYAAVRFWEKFGIRRIILSRELRIDEIEEIRKQCPEMEIEVFVHGSLCIAYSGRCLLSGYFNHRDSNQGNCSNACRWNYKVGQNAEEGGSCCSSSESGAQRHEKADEPWFLEEKSRPGQQMPVFEDENGTYIMNSKDLRAIEHVRQLMEIGVHSLKIEGRTKSKYYVARTAQAYRRAIDDAMAGKAFDPALLDGLDRLASRGYTDGFFSRQQADDTQNYETDRPYSETRYAGDVVSYDASRRTAVVHVKNRIEVGDFVEIVHPSGNFAEKILSMHKLDGSSLDAAPGDGWTVVIPFSRDLSGGMLAVVGGSALSGAGPASAARSEAHAGASEQPERQS